MKSKKCEGRKQGVELYNYNACEWGKGKGGDDLFLTSFRSSGGFVLGHCPCLKTPVLGAF